MHWKTDTFTYIPHLTYTPPLTCLTHTCSIHGEEQDWWTGGWEEDMDHLGVAEKKNDRTVAMNSPNTGKAEGRKEGKGTSRAADSSEPLPLPSITPMTCATWETCAGSTAVLHHFCCLPFVFYISVVPLLRGVCISPSGHAFCCISQCYYQSQTKFSTTLSFLLYIQAFFIFILRAYHHLVRPLFTPLSSFVPL